ncbi:hypothetical protein CY34DRAFT_152279 [Suillus luteus UH-Slu-Lm8-n1]|uniref:Uncharacterized protein n=1 Tax=Suillus luteus UH-Slu-Lm8-n1 TaxID=930992 RepID=A0A0D0AX13_9AGAM|nr:hypothetical protein CY34DRAFT_152279 [Suillus luteus UH-Slu-Lm8-n1]
MNVFCGRSSGWSACIFLHLQQRLEPCCIHAGFNFLIVLALLCYPTWANDRSRNERKCDGHRLSPDLDFLSLNLILRYQRHGPVI